MNIGLEYIKYRWNAKGRDRIHSPFLNDLIKNCLRIKLETKDTHIIRSIGNEMKSSKESIEIEDFGAGSKYLGKTRPIPSILKTSSSKGKYGEFLYQVCKHYKFKNTLEFGTSLGIGSSYMALGNKEGTITTIEACENTRKLALNNFKSKEINNIKSIHSTFSEYLNNIKNEQFDLIYIDGHHDGEALLSYMEKLQNYSHSKTMFILDDIRWSDSMLNAWNIIKKSPQYSFSLDLFRFGIVIPAIEENKANYTLSL